MMWNLAIVCIAGLHLPNKEETIAANLIKWLCVVYEGLDKLLFLTLPWDISLKVINKLSLLCWCAHCSLLNAPCLVLQVWTRSLVGILVTVGCTTVVLIVKDSNFDILQPPEYRLFAHRMNSEHLGKMISQVRFLLPYIFWIKWNIVVTYCYFLCCLTLLEVLVSYLWSLVIRTKIDT